MTWMIALLELYLAAMLGISGLAKIEDTAYFEDTLRRHRILPGWSIPATARSVSWLEVVVAIALILGLVPVPTALIVIGLFVSFLIIETILVVTQRATPCGCFGVAYSQRVDGASLIVSMILIGLSVLHLWSITLTPSIAIEWRVVVIVIGGASGVWIVARMIRRHRLVYTGVSMDQEAQTTESIASSNLQPPISNF